jgi:hypothetical protein
LIIIIIYFSLLIVIEKFKEYNDRLSKFFERVEKGYQGEHPLHQADPAHSAFHIMSFSDFEKMFPKELERIHRRKNIVVTGCRIEDPNLEFNEAGLRTLAPLDSQISILGRSSVTVQ